MDTRAILEHMYGIRPRKVKRGWLWRIARSIRRLRMAWQSLPLKIQQYNLQLTVWSLAAALWIITHIYYYNQLTFLEQSVDVAAAQIEVGQQKRSHVQRNLLALVRYYAAYERGTMKDVTAMRVKPGAPLAGEDVKNAGAGAPLAAEAVQNAAAATPSAPEAGPNHPPAFESLSAPQLLGQLRMVAEQYPSLQLNGTVQQFSKIIVDSEGEIADRIMAYNVSVHIYMTRRTQFPVRMFASMMGFHPKEFYQPENRAVLAYGELKP